MMTMDLERHLSLFYGVCSKMKYFYWYNDIDTLFSLCKVNNYFYKSKKIIYNTIIVYLSILQPIEGINKPVGGSVVINGIAREKETLTVDTSNISDEDGLGTFSYQWYRDSSSINGANDSSYKSSNVFN